VVALAAGSLDRPERLPMMNCSTASSTGASLLSTIVCTKNSQLNASHCSTIGLPIGRPSAS